MFTITTDAARKLIEVRLGGLFSPDEVDAFGRAQQAAARSLGARSGAFLLMAYTEGAVVQTQEVMQAFQAILLRAPLKARRIAMVREGVLTRMQTRRLAKLRDDFEVFDNATEAEAWLFGADTLAA